MRRVDSGGDIAQSAIPCDWEDIGVTLYEKAAKEIILLFINTYPKLKGGDIRCIHQNLTKGTFHLAKEIDSASNIDLDEKYYARNLINLIRARTFEGKPACYFNDNRGNKFEVHI